MQMEILPHETDSGSCAFVFPVLSCLSEKEALLIDNRSVVGMVRRRSVKMTNGEFSRLSTCLLPGSRPCHIEEISFSQRYGITHR